jgi:hypothetical protein
MGGDHALAGAVALRRRFGGEFLRELDGQAQHPFVAAPEQGQGPVGGHVPPGLVELEPVAELLAFVFLALH